MRGYLMGGVSAVSVLIFCVCLFTVSNVLMFWLFLELATLSLVPAFFLGRDLGGIESLFSYLVVSSISSSFMVCGLLFEGLLGFFFFGFLMKFGVFPFLGWVYKVVTGSNWTVVWGFSTLLKSPFLFLCFFFSGAGASSLNLLVVLTFLVLSWLFWVYTYTWFHCWCHMMVSSSAALVAMSSVISLDSVGCLYFFYVFWASLVILFLSGQGNGGLMLGGSVFVYCFLLLSLPCSLSVFYKLIMGLCMYSCFFPVFLFWVFYSLSEQFYLMKLLVDLSLPRVEGGSLGLV